MNKIIYLDNACTSHPKPDAVWEAMKNYQKNIGASPARSGHTLGKRADVIVSETRELLATLFHVSDPQHIVFTQNSTHALNLIIKGTLNPGDHVVTTNLEHNSVLRPLENLARAGDITYTVVESDSEGLIHPEDIEAAMQPNTQLVVANHASNAFGVISPISEIGKIAHSHGARFLVDASQTAGVIPIDVEKQNIDYLAFTGHKSLGGPSGIGGCYIKDPDTVRSFTDGGSGNSMSPIQPAYMPDKFEAGTLNYQGIAGLGAALKHLQQHRSTITAQEMELTRYLIANLQKIPEVTLYGTLDLEKKVPVISFTLKGFFANKLAGILDVEYGILTRPGLHCAPRAHRTFQTAPTGTVRVSIGYKNTQDDIDALLHALKDIIEKTQQK